MLTGWANYFYSGQVSPAYRAINQHTHKRLRRWFYRKYKIKSGGYVRLLGNAPMGAGLRPTAKAMDRPPDPKGTAPPPDSTARNADRAALIELGRFLAVIHFPLTLPLRRALLAAGAERRRQAVQSHSV